MSTKRKANDQLNLKNYLEKKSRIYGTENVDYDEEEEKFENGNHPVQIDSEAAFKQLNQLMHQKSSLAQSFNLDTQSTAMTSTQMHDITTQPATSLPNFDDTFNNTLLQEEISKDWALSQAIINDLTESNSNDDELDQDIIGLTPKICHVLTTQRGLKNLYPWQKRCLRQSNVKHFKSLCYQVPTGGGKSLIAEILILKQIFQKQKDAVLVLPYVSLVQEKVASFSMLGTKLNFLVEEYAAGKGKLPPIQRRKANTLYICTIEKASALVDSLMFEKRLDEIGIVVVDEIHMLYEEGKRGGTLEALITKVKLHKETEIQIVGMSATIPNLTEVSDFLKGSKFENNERPVVLKHYVKDGESVFIAKIDSVSKSVDFEFEKTVKSNSNQDSDGVMDLIYEVVEKEGNVIVFCATKRQCESLANIYIVFKIHLLHHI